MRPRIVLRLANPVGMVGVVVAAVGLAASTISLAVDMLSHETNPYRGILTYGAFPGLIFFGLSLCLLGVFLYRRHVPAEMPRLNLSDPRQRRIAALTAAGLFLFVFLSTLGAYQAFHFTEDTAFCGTLCHEVMEPEHTAYLNSPHARVPCVECHVGEGAEWYVRAKITGLYQVYATLANKFPRPIPTPIENLRPAQETCARCHWPEKFWGAQFTDKIRFSFDVANTRREVLMLVKTGGGGSAHGPSEGIHWHMNIRNRVEYIPRDSKRLDIPWVKITYPDGTSKEYTDSEDPLPPAEVASRERRVMDCMDCHNRPSHTYASPSEMVDRLMAIGRVSPKVPNLKAEATAVLAKEYATPEEAMQGIETGLTTAYAQRYPELARTFRKEILDAIPELQGIFRQNVFPRMKASWAVYPTHISHKEFPGCFRCHTDRMRDPEGNPLSSDCSLCHDFVARSGDGKTFHEVPADPTIYHPWSQPRAHASLGCWDCHTGASSPYDKCGSCHDIDPTAPMAFACATCHQPGKPEGPRDCVSCHAVGGSPLHALPQHQACESCHAAHDWKTSDPLDCSRSCHAELAKTHYPDQACVPCHAFQGVTSGFGSAPVPPSVKPGRAPAAAEPKVEPTPEPEAKPEPGTPTEAAAAYAKDCLSSGCHATLLEKPKVHGPVASATCSACHEETDREKHTFELSAEEEDLCSPCHVLPASAKVVHKPFAAKSCLSCHDPHGGADRNLLTAPAGEVCLECHSKPETAHLHDPVAKGDCSACHRAHQSDLPALLPKPEAELCATCHPAVLQEIRSAALAHAPVAKGCNTCHPAHGASTPQLLVRSYPPGMYAPFREEAYGLCLASGCHVGSLFTEPKSTLTKFRDGDRNLHFVHVQGEKGRTCGTCHATHAGPEPSLIHESVTFGPGGWKLPIGFRPAPGGGTCASGCHEEATYRRDKAE